MDKDKLDHGNRFVTPDASRTRELELRYIELLEMRIAALEALTKEQSTQPSGQKTTTTEENVTNFLKINGHSEQCDRANMVNSPAESGGTATRIRFRESRYNNEGVETMEDVSDNSPPMPEQPRKQNDLPDLIWLRAFDDKHKYTHSEVEVESFELRNLLHIELAHDPRFHSPSDSLKNSITLTSPFEPLVHNWERLDSLANAGYDSDAWKSLQRRISEIDPRNDKEVEHSPHTSALVVLADEKNTKKAFADLAALLNQVRTTPELKAYFLAMEVQRQSQSIQFEHLWTIFPPGELVYSTVFMKKDQIFIVKECTAKIIPESDSGREKDTKRFWSLVCWTYDWDGRIFNRVPIAFRFEEFQSARLINTLHCHPLRHHNTDTIELATLRKNLIDRGKRFRNLCIRQSGSQMFNYNGVAISHGAGFQRLKENQNDDPDHSMLAAMISRRRGSSRPLIRKLVRRQHVDGHVMVDFESYLQHAPNFRKYGPMEIAVFSDRDDECRCASCINNQSLKDNQKTEYDNYGRDREFKDETQYLICPPRVLGYHLETKTWLELDSEKVENVEQPRSEKAFERLELVKTQKDLIRELVQSHTSGTGKHPMMEDILKEKGKGLVILLHGPPGVGKTLTAESVAQLAGKPLFSVSPSDIGLNPAEVEQNLETLFELAARWRAVLLFDEADVFLESRSSHSSDLTRNALVSVLLRVLEYYNGILILTTNRIQQFDIAVQSRVNLGIKYKDLSMEQKKKIFTNFIEQIPEQNIDDKEELERWLEEDTDAAEWFEALNGRQVRNVLFSAASLAQHSGGMLRVSHIKKMAKSTWQFQDSIKSIVEEARRKAEVGRV